MKCETSGCSEPFPDMTFYLHLQRRHLYYVMNIILPCMMMSLLTMTTFALPAESGEKINLGLTVSAAKAEISTAHACRVRLLAGNAVLQRVHVADCRNDAAHSRKCAAGQLVLDHNHGPFRRVRNHVRNRAERAHARPRPRGASASGQKLLPTPRSPASVQTRRAG